ncbi:MAG: GAF domain-containing protein, partial [Acidobacteriota bacterium]
MAERLLDVGLSAHIGVGDEADVAGVAHRLVEEALRQCRHMELPARCAVLLATADWSHREQGLPRLVRETLREKLHYAVPLIGGSMASVFSSCYPEGLIENGVALAVLCSHDLWVTVTAFPEPFSYSDCDRVARLKELAEILEREGRVRLGTSSDRYLLGILPGYVEWDGQRRMCDAELYYQILAAFEHRFHLYGASATDNLRTPGAGHQFANDLCLKSGLALAMMESDLRVGSAMRHDFQPLAAPRVSVQGLADGNDLGYVVERLDGKPAAQRLRELREQVSLVQGEPVFGLHSGADYKLMLVVNPDEGGAVRLNRKVALGDCLYVMVPPASPLTVFCQRAIKDALAAAGGTGEELAFLLGFGCARLFRHYVERGAADLREIGRWFTGAYASAAVIGGLPAGEYAVDPGSGPRASHMSVWLRCYLNRYSPRAANRELRQRLHEASNAVVSSASPAAVMATALEGAAKAGAEGGQICLVDSNLGKILGKGHGYAYQKPGSSHYWHAVLELTERPCPTDTGGDYPAEIQEWVMPVGGDMDLRPSSRVGEFEEDILTLAVRTRLAIFVPDALDSRFHCKRGAVEAGGIKVMLVVPLTGAKGQAIGTIQLSFPDDTAFDREAMTLWVNFAHKVGIALERELDAEDRQIEAEIVAAAQAAAAAPVNPEAGPYGWCSGFASKVRRLLEAGYVHMRVHRPGQEGEELVLVAGDGLEPLRTAHINTRPVTRGGKDGGCTPRMLKRGGIVTHDRLEVAALHWKVMAIEKVAEYGEVLRNELDKIQATAMLPLMHAGQLVGSLVIDCLGETWFTQRRERLARLAAAQAAPLVPLKRNAYYRARLHDYRSWLEAKSVRIESSERRSCEEIHEWLREALRQLCEFAHADWASVFAWHGAPDKFILHTALNWREQGWEGRASYRRGEGWIGWVAVQTELLSYLPYSEERPGVLAKYHHAIEPAGAGERPADCAPRIGMKLMSGGKLLGVAALGCYRKKAGHLIALDEGASEVLRYGAEVISLSLAVIREITEEAEQERLSRVKQEFTTRL